MVRVPRVVVAAPATGQGKTTVTIGLLAALRASGAVVSAHKVGPDFIDPGFHASATGRPGRNLDPWLVGEDRIAPLFVHGASTPTRADIAVIEGVMGLFDGVSGAADFGSTAHVARLLDAPVVLVVDVSAMARSVAAVVHGFAGFDPSVRVGGVIANQVGSPGHADLVRDALESVGVPLLGAIPSRASVALPSRHLGLVPAAERPAEVQGVVAELGAMVAEHVDLEAVVRLARSAPDLPARAPWPASDVGEQETVRVALAAGPAFTFGYTEQVELLRDAGAEVVTFDPLRDESLPADTAALVIGGGFPEEYAAELAANVPLINDVRRLARTGAPIAAECAGLVYLARSLDGLAMCGLLDVETRMTERLVIGYRDAVAADDSVLADAGQRVAGQEFHRTECSPATAGTRPAWFWRQAGERRTDGFVAGSMHASYLHLHWAGNPWMAQRFVQAARP